VPADDRGVVPVRDAIEFVAANDLADLNLHVSQTKVRGDE
jgi:hypothetical protein